jgi:flagellar basal-body rod modification protein FlgD
MSVYGIGNSTETVARTNTPTASSSAKELQDQFLLLLVTQLQNQDPLNPMDNTNFTSQLAQFSSLEQLTQVNDGIRALAAAQNSMQNAYLVNLIGKEVMYESSSPYGNDVKVLHGTVTGISYDSGGSFFMVNGTEKVAIGDILQVMQPRA